MVLQQLDNEASNTNRRDRAKVKKQRRREKESLDRDKRSCAGLAAFTRRTFSPGSDRQVEVDQVCLLARKYWCCLLDHETTC